MHDTLQETRSPQVPPRHPPRPHICTRPNMTPPLLTNLHADLLPHRRWGVRKWFYASPLWYYHGPSPDHRVQADSQFYALMDPNLRPLCRLLHQAGVRTTPSCQGHFYPREHFQRVWGQITRDAAAITQAGLPVRDSETGRLYLFRNPAYTVPWPTFEAFHDQVALHQTTGYLGILLPRERSELYESFLAGGHRSRTSAMLFDPYLGRLLASYVFHLFVHTPNPEQQARQWRYLTDLVHSALVRVPQVSR